MKKLILFLGLLAVTFMGCGEQSFLIINSEYPGDYKMWDHFFAVEGEYKFESAPLGIILPHHLIAAESITKFYKGLTKVINPSVIFILGPNHYENGNADIQTCKNCVYTTTNGIVELDLNFVNKLINDDIAVMGDEIFKKEHTFFTHTPFIKRFFPDAKIVPIAVKLKISIEKVLELSDWFDKNLPENVLVLTSVDFSHYQPLSVADLHDQASFAAITNFEFEKIYNLELDSPSSIYALLDLMKKRGYIKVERLAHTNLATIIEKPDLKETTSHQYFAFYK